MYVYVYMCAVTSIHKSVNYPQNAAVELTSPVQVSLTVGPFVDINRYVIVDHHSHLLHVNALGT